MVYQILSYMRLEGNEPPSEVVPHPDTTKEAPSGMDIADDGKVTGAALKKGKHQYQAFVKKQRKKNWGKIILLFLTYTLSVGSDSRTRIQASLLISKSS